MGRGLKIASGSRRPAGVSIASFSSSRSSRATCSGVVGRASPVRAKAAGRRSSTEASETVRVPFLFRLICAPPLAALRLGQPPF